MTERKPPGVRFESWVEKQIREAHDRGSFDDLPGSGRPLPTTASDELAWVREKVRREGLPTSALLPPSLAVAKEVEDLPEVLAGLRSEERVRQVLGALNGRIDAARRAPAAGPPVRTGLLDVEQIVAQWREALPPVTVAAASPGDATPSTAPARGLRWWRRRSA